ncbi:plasmid mobilization protein [Salinibacter sp.]|uniref:plasmid mobilization protein n=1 Tax=Salinibacter sp. TaxID=2065818 RepID=UPI0021E7DBDA|nr:hypothetical protein [Salinibacter sp.]
MSEDSHPSLFGDENNIRSGSSSDSSHDRKTEEEGEDPSGRDQPDNGFSDRNTGGDGSGDPPAEDPVEDSSRQDSAEEGLSDQDGFPDRNTSNEDNEGDGGTGKGSSTENKSSSGSSSGSPAGGRPPKPDEERRDARLSVCMTEDLLSKIEQQAEDAGLSKSAYARRALAGKDLQTRVDQQVLDTLYSVGTSMRNVQEAIEAGRRPKAADVEKALQALETVIEEIDQRGE